MRISLNSVPTLNQTYEFLHGTLNVNYSTMASHLPWYKFILHNKITFNTDGETKLYKAFTEIFLMYYIVLLPSLLRHFEFQTKVCLYLLQICCLGKLMIKFTLTVLLMLTIFKRDRKL